MLSSPILISNKLGLHARASSKLVMCASQYTSEITISKDNKYANAKSIMSVMMLAAVCGNTVTITVNGSDEQVALDAIIKLFNDKFGEEQ